VTTKTFSLAELLTRSGERMSHDLTERLVPHRGEQGAARENVVREFLRSHLPSRFDVSSGFVFDSHGAVSSQIDIIVADAMVTPRFEVAGGVRFYPCESVVAVGQVKTHCDSRRKAWDALCNLRSVSTLDRSAGGRALCDRSGVPIDHKREHLDRIFTFLLVIDKVLDADSMREVILEYVQRSDSHTWPSIVFALGRYLATYACDDGVCPNTIHARGISVARDEDGNNALLQFYVFLSQAIVSTRVARMSSWHHLGNAASPNAEVIYSVRDDPPPFLETVNALAGLPFECPYADDE
jgi:hypothetical protein